VSLPCLIEGPIIASMSVPPVGHIRMSTSKSTPSVLFVCTGNICRSPTAHALLLHKAAARGFAVQADSAAIRDDELGNPPDRRALFELQRRGVSMPAHRARLVAPEDFVRFDRIVGMTVEHVRILKQQAPSQASKIDLLMRYADEAQAVDVPDPWYGGERDFVEAFDMIDAGVEGLLQQWQRGR
jgi:protein-tyrosine phosphatase